VASVVTETVLEISTRECDSVTTAVLEICGLHIISCTILNLKNYSRIS
jgi:hypothetical protein